MVATASEIVVRAGFFCFFVGYRGIVHPPSADEGTERTLFEPEQRLLRGKSSLAHK